MQIGSATTAAWGKPYVGQLVRPSRVACLGLILASLCVFAFNIRQGIGIYPDSTRYMGFGPEPYDAPMYHWLLTWGQGIGIPLITAALATAVIALCANVGLIFALIKRASGDWRYAAAGTALIAFSPQFVTLHASAMSEPPFITFLLLTMWMALNYLEWGRRRWLVLSSILLGVATLTRFTAPPLGAAIALVILANPRHSVRQRLADCMLLALVGGGLFLSWMVFSQLTAGHSIGRELWFYGNQGPAQWRNNLETLAAWIFPDEVSLAMRIAPLAGLFAFAGWQSVRQFRLLRKETVDSPFATRVTLSLVLALFFVGYLAFVGLATSIEANLSLTGRYGLPAYIVFAMLLTIQASGHARTIRSERAIWFALVALGALVLASHSIRSAARSAEVFRDGFGYQHRVWRESPTIEAIRMLPRSASIYSNAPDAVAFLTGRKAQLSPRERQLRTNLPEPGNPLNRQFKRIRGESSRNPIFIVVLDKLDWRFYLASEQRLQRGLPLSLTGRFADGRIYLVRPQADRGRP